MLALMAGVAPQLNIYTAGFSLQAIAALAGGCLLLPDLVHLMALVVGRVGEIVRALA